MLPEETDFPFTVVVSGGDMIDMKKAQGAFLRPGESLTRSLTPDTDQKTSKNR